MAFATCLYHGDVFWHLISAGIYEKSLFYCRGSSKMHVEHPKRNVTFFWIVFRFATAPAILFHHFNLPTFFAVISHTSAFQCVYRHCQALTYVMIIGLCLDRLPGRIFLHAFQHFFYYTSMGKHLWAASPDTAHSLWSPKYNRSVQHNMKSDHRSTTKACNVT